MNVRIENSSTSFLLFLIRILRKDEESSNIHFFSTQFFQKIQDQGPESVLGWTRRRNINIFEKKFIFIPINDYLHWSLCIVVNPGKLENSFTEEDESVSKDNDEKVDIPFLLFLDSLKAHQASKVKKHLYDWLNLEAKRLNTFEVLSEKYKEKKSELFTQHSMPIFEPKIPYQNNGWDCGVFVCRYAFGVMALRNVNFHIKKSKDAKHRKQETKRLLKEIITEGNEFAFDMSDIERLRREFATLIDKLSDMYKRKKQEERRQAKSSLKEEQNTTEEQENAAKEPAKGADETPSEVDEYRNSGGYRV